MKVAIISHTYLEPENQKNLLALSALCDVRCVLPRRGPVLIFKNYEFVGSPESSHIFLPCRTFYLSKAQYIFISPTMGLLAFKPDVINIDYSPWSLMFFQVLLYRWMFSPKSKIVCTIKKNTYRCKPGLFGRVKDLVARFSMKKVDHIIAASNMVADLCNSEFAFPVKKVTVCHHLGVDVSLFKPIGKKCQDDNNPQNPIVVGYCGRFDEDKGILDLIEAIRLAKQTVKQTIVLKLMGCGAYGDFLDKHLKNESQRVDWLELLPPVPNAEVAIFLRTLDIFVLPSRILDDHQEHDAHILLEAMASGVACVGTKSGIIPEILGRGYGYVVSPENPYELCDVLCSMINNSDDRSMLAKRGRKMAVDKFALNEIAKKKYTIFKGVVNED